MRDVRTILLIEDDDEETRRLLADNLRRAGYPVVVALDEGAASSGIFSPAC